MSQQSKSFSQSHQQNRRAFIKTLSAGSTGLLILPHLASCTESYESTLFEHFQNPLAEARPFFRWWWNDNRLSKDELARELELMHEAGIGGIEINPIKMHDTAEPLVGKEYTWLSDEWIDFLQYTISKAHNLGMIVDLIVGTGWPFGAEFLDLEETIQGLRLEKIEVSGPKKHHIDLAKNIASETTEVLRIDLFPEKIEQLLNGKNVTFEAGQEKVEVTIPSGKHIIYILSLHKNFRQVMHGAPGGAGPVLDHFNKSAVEKYLNHMSDRIKEKLDSERLEGIRAMFCDSIELNGANWTKGFESHFRDKHGYDILPYIPLLLSDETEVGTGFEDELRRARFDYNQTLAELFIVSFIKPFHNWCNENGTLSRYQAYGHPWLYTDLIDGYLIPDIPEGDQWLFNGAWQPYADIDQIRYAIWNKYTSSAGHLAGKKIISTESMTNTSGVFKASLKYIKQGTDVNLVTGINHQVLHGFNYSPPEAGFPGWIRYGCYFNEQNPWWQYMRLWSDYCARLSQVFQDASMVSQVAIMGPTLDHWSNHGLDRNPFNMEPWYLHAFWQALNHLGFGTDYVNGNVVKSATLDGGNIVMGSMKYKALLLCDIETMEVDVARKIEMLVRQGARIVTVGQKPNRSPNMVSALKNDGIVRKAIEDALSSGLLTAESPGNNLKKSPQHLMEWTDQLMQNAGVIPTVSFTNPSPNIFQAHLKHAGTDILFIANTSREEDFSSEISFGEPTRNAVKWDPFNGTRQRMKVLANSALDISLDPLESMLIVADPRDTIGLQSRARSSNAKEEHMVKGPWEASLKGIDGSTNNLVLETLTSIGDIEGHAKFGGEILYKTNFELQSTDHTEIFIEEVFETAEVTLNGASLGISWWGNNRFNIGDNLEIGENVLEIKVTTLLANYVASLKEDKTAQFWTSRYKDKSSVKCGIVGKVVLR